MKSYRIKKYIKGIITLFLIFSLAFLSFASVTNENDQMAFITKAEFNNLKKDYQMKVSNLFSNIDKKIDEAEILYLQKYVKSTNLKNCPYPIGAIYISTNDTNPSELIGGTWESFGAGRTLFSYRSGDYNFNTLLKTGGSQNHTLTIQEYPSHTHTFTSTTGTATTQEGGALHTHEYGYKYWTAPSGSAYAKEIWDSPDHGTSPETGKTTTQGSHTHNITWTGDIYGNTPSGEAFSVMQPYIVVCFWRRVA